MRILIKYFRLWYTLTVNSFIISLASRFSAGIFLLAKVFRFGFFVIFLVTLVGKSQLLASYSLLQTLFFFMTFTFIDTVTSLFFREVYRFRPMVVSGDFDLVLVKPFNPLFRALAGGADPLDLITLVPYTILIVFIGSKFPSVDAWHVALYLLLLGNALLIATGFHILVLALAILTTEIDHAIMIYRDLTSMGRVPVDIYQEPLRSIITFVIPVGIMMTFPAKALLGLLSPVAIGVSFIGGFIFFRLCLRAWRYSLSQYSSASS